MKMDAGEFGKVVADAKARKAKIDPVRLAILEWHLLLERI